MSDEKVIEMKIEIAEDNHTKNIEGTGISKEYGRYIPLKIVHVKNNKLNSSLCVPSHMHEYSMCIEYAKKWVLDKFPKDFFKSIYIDGEHALSEYRKYTREQFIKRQKPSLAIVAQEDYTFDNENINLILNNPDMYINRSGAVTPFFSDKRKNLYLKMMMKIILINFNFRIRVNTRSKQLDLYRYIMTAFNVGTTHGYYMTMDYHVPIELMLQLAKDAGFTVHDKIIEDSLGFVSYLNSNSLIPFLYKLRCSTGNNEFFVRVPNLYVHHRVPNDLEIDEGERQGHISSNYTLEFHATLRFPCPFFYAYYTETEQEKVVFITDDGEMSYASNFNYMPQINSKGWYQYITTEYDEEDITKPLVIDFNELFANGDKESQQDTDMSKLIKYTKSLKINPGVFMEIKVFNDRKEIPYILDWDTLKMTLKQLVTSPKTFISIYVDNKYFNEQLININEYTKSRMSKDGNGGSNSSL